MPYDPRMLQMARMGVGMMDPQQGNPFADRTSPPRPKQWWEQPIPGAPAQQGDQQPMGLLQMTQQGPAADPNAPRSPYDMLLNLGRMTRPQYDKAIQGPGAYGIAPKDAARLGPWGFLGSLGLPGGAGWGGSGSGGPG